MWIWFHSILPDSKIVGGAIFGFISALLIFLIRDVIWANRMEQLKLRRDFQQKQLEYLYEPLYHFYRKSYARYDLWKKDNQDTQMLRQPFYEADNEEDLVENTFSDNYKYSSDPLLRARSIYSATTDKALKSMRRREIVAIIVKEYQGLRKELCLSYNHYELMMGQFEKLT